MPQGTSPQYRVLAEKDVPTPTRDRVSLRAAAQFFVTESFTYFVVHHFTVKNESTL